MPKLKRTRLINLKYNNDNRVLYDKTFDMNGKSTLFVMDNGIGKTVLVQFFLQPFIRNHSARKLGLRNFEDYFSGSEPVTIIHEAILDNGTDYFMFGMTIRADQDVENKKKLRILAFTHTYNRKNNHDIVRLPFVTDADGRRRILSFHESEALLKHIQRENRDFEVFNLNDKTRKDDYFQRLSERRINFREFEGLIRKINEKEGGLSEMYSDSITSENLLVRNILPTIESKLNSGIDILSNLRTELCRHIRKRAGENDILHRLETFQAFRAESDAIAPLLDSYRKEAETLTDLEASLAAIHVYLLEKSAAIDREKSDFTTLRLAAEQEIRDIRVQELSYGVHELLEQLREADGILADLSRELESLATSTAVHERECIIQRCAGEHSSLVKKTRELSQVVERIRLSESTDNEILQRIRNYRYTLKKLHTEERETLEAKRAELKDELETQKKALSEFDKEKRDLEKRIQTVNRDHGAKESLIEQFFQKEREFLATHSDFTAQRNLAGTYDEAAVRGYGDQVAHDITRCEKDCSDSETKRKVNESEITTLKGKNRELTPRIDDVRSQFQEAERAQSEFNRHTEGMVALLEKYGLGLSVIENKGKLQLAVSAALRQFRDDRDLLDRRRHILEAELRRVEEDSMLELPPDLKREMEDSGIEAVSGLQRLRDRNDTFETKRDLVRKNPFLPYALLLEPAEVDAMKRFSSTTQAPVPILDHTTFHRASSLTVEDHCVLAGDIRFYVGFPEYLLDNERRAEKILEFKSEIDVVRTNLLNLDEAIARVHAEERQIADYPYTGNEGAVLAAKLSQLDGELDRLQKEVCAREECIERLAQENETLLGKVRQAMEDKYRIEQKRVFYNGFMDTYRTYLAAIDEKARIEEQLAEFSKRKDELEAAVASVQEAQSKTRLQQNEANRTLTKCLENVARFESAEDGERVDGTITELTAALEVCESGYVAEIRRDREQENTLRDDIEALRNRIRDALLGTDILESDYAGILYDGERVRELKELICSQEETMGRLRNQKSDTERSCDQVDNKIENARTELKKFNVESELPKEWIRGTDFRTRIQAEKQLIQECEEAISALDADKTLCISEMGRLERYHNEEPVTPCDEVPLKDLRPVVSELLIGTQQAAESADACRARVKQGLNKLFRTFNERHALFREHLGRLIDVLETEPIEEWERGLSTIRYVVDRFIFTDIKVKENLLAEEEVIFNEIQRHSMSIYEEMLTIDRNSTIALRGQRKKMLTIKPPERDNLNAEGVRLYVRNIVESVCGELDDAKIDGEVAARLRAEHLFAQLVGGLARVDIKIYKVEVTTIKLMDWEEINRKNSGAERLLTSFVVFASLLAYTRKQRGDLQNSSESSVIITDNPFTQIQAEYVLVPMFDVAKKLNIQLICLSGIGGAAIYNRFDVIYVANIIPDEFRRKEVLEFTRVDEEGQTPETLELGRFEYMDQLSLFEESPM